MTTSTVETAAVTPAAWLSMRWAFVAGRLRTVYAYRTDILVWLLAPALQAVMLGALWRAVYDGRATVNGVSLSVMTTYVSLAAMQGTLNHDDTVDWLDRRVRDGKIGTDMARPVGLLWQQVCGQVAQMLMSFPMVALLLPVLLLFNGMNAPAPGALLPYALSTLLGWFVYCCLQLLLGAVAFWTTEVGGMEFLYFVMSGFLSGILVPLWVMPDWLAGILAWLPWQAIVYTPVAIYIGRFEGARMWEAVGVQAAWVAVLFVFVRLVWGRAVHRVVVQGG